ncbi:export-related chaperone CsaA, partial [mine drainage metagenome]
YKNYSEEDLVGRNIIAAINLGTKRIAGAKSEFLILGALMADGEVRLLTPDGDDIFPGQPIG